MQSHNILQTRVHATTYPSASNLICSWAQARESRYVCAANVHMVMEAYDDAVFSAAINEADLVTSDGMPLVWTLKRLGAKEATRVYGPDLMLAVCEQAERDGIAIGLYGGRVDGFDALETFLLKRFPNLKIAFHEAPPFRPLYDEEDEATIKAINESDTGILFVALGCPKQERWMAQRRGQINSVMIGVGMAFDIYAGAVKQAPKWMQKPGLEWLYRLTQDPKRLWKRYAVHNPRFVLLVLWQLLRGKLGT